MSDSNKIADELEEFIKNKELELKDFLEKEPNRSESKNMSEEEIYKEWIESIDCCINKLKELSKILKN